MTIELTQSPKIKITIVLPSGERGILSFFAENDGSCYMKCPQRFLSADEYRFGIIAMPGGVTRLNQYDMTSANGFVETSNDEPKISFHPTGYIQASLSAPHQSDGTRRVNMGRSLIGLHARTVAVLQWQNVAQYVPNPKTRANYQNLKFVIDYEPTNLMAILKVGGSLADFGELNITENGNNSTAPIELPHTVLTELKDGHFLVIKLPLWQPSYFNVVDELSAAVIKAKHNLGGFLFAVRVPNQGLIWYQLLFFNPLDIPQTANSSVSFIFNAGMKNWDANETRETGEKIVLLGRKNAP